MRIVVNDIAAKKGGGGVFSILEDFYNEARQSDPCIEWIFLLSAPYFEETDHIKIILYPELKASYLKRLNFEFIKGRYIVNKLKPDLYFSLQNTATCGIKAQQIVYLHQPLNYAKKIKKFSFFKSTERRLAVYQHLIGGLINFLFKLNKPAIIVQTHWLKETLIKKFNWATDKVKVYAPHLSQINSDKSITIDSTHFFYPATPFIYKNHACIIRAVELLNKEGVHDFSVDFTVKKKDLSENQLPSQINCLGTIPRAQVLNLYQRSVLLFPSYIETFGLPLAEAALSGTKILAADIPTTREVLNNYHNVSYFKYDDVQKLALLMKNTITSKSEKDDQYQIGQQGVIDDIVAPTLVDVILKIHKTDH